MMRYFFKILFKLLIEIACCCKLLRIDVPPRFSLTLIVHKAIFLMDRPDDFSFTIETVQSICLRTINQFGVFCRLKIARTLRTVLTIKIRF